MIAIITATEKEMKSAMAFASGVPVVRQGEAASFAVQGRQLLLCVSGVGVINAALCAGRILARGDVRGVVNLGVAGAFDLEGFPFGTAFKVWREIWPEYGLLTEDGIVSPVSIGLPQGVLNGKPVWDKVKVPGEKNAALMGLELPTDLRSASSLTVSGVTGSSVRAGWLRIAYSVDIENMEGYALAFACAMSGVPFLEIRAISNMVGSREPEDWDLDGALTALGEVAANILGKAEVASHQTN